MNMLLKASAMYAIISSVCMLLLLSALFLTGASSDILGARTAYTFALLPVEALTSTGLMTSGIAILKKKQWVLE